jgi:UDPglucose 6-dehydrogenase
MDVVVFGTGYVGLVTGSGLSTIGHSVTCLDTDLRKIDMLNKGIVPIYEPDLEAIIKESTSNNELSFLHLKDDNTVKKINDADCLFVAVGTPQSEDGSADLTFVYSVIDFLAENLKLSKPVLIKSTVPPGTCCAVQDYANNKGLDITVISNPEFLREGLAVSDFYNPDRIVIGNNTSLYPDIGSKLYSNLKSEFLNTDTTSAELIKYASNAMLATRISFMNELSLIADKVGAKIKDVERGVGLDSRIGNKFLSAGLGYGGSCFPKDVCALEFLGRSLDVDCKILNSVTQRNKDMITVALNKILKSNCKSVLFFGAAFKPDTDDTRESASVKLINQLTKCGITVYCYDPIVKEADVSCKIYNNLEDTFLLSYDAIVIGTELLEAKTFDYNRAKETSGVHTIFDFRNIVNPPDNFKYVTIGNN